MKIKDWLADASPNGKQENMIRKILKDKHNLILISGDDEPQYQCQIKYNNLCLSVHIEHIHDLDNNDKTRLICECNLDDDFKITSIEIFGKLKLSYDLNKIKKHILKKANYVLDAIDDTYHEVINWKINNLELKDEWR